MVFFSGNNANAKLNLHYRTEIQITRELFASMFSSACTIRTSLKQVLWGTITNCAYSVAENMITQKVTYSFERLVRSYKLNSQRHFLPWNISKLNDTSRFWQFVYLYSSDVFFQKLRLGYFSTQARPRDQCSRAILICHKTTISRRHFTQPLHVA